jgi:hypothetical protein
LSVLSDVSFTSNLFIGGRINNTLLDTSLNAKANIAAPSFIGLIVSAGDVSMNSKLSVLSDVSFTSNLFVGGSIVNAGLTNSLALKANLAAPSFTGTIISAGDISLNNRISVTSDSSFNGNLFVGGVISSQSLESLLSSSTLNIGANQTNGTLNIGTNASRSGDINIGTGTNMKWVNICSQGNGVVRIKGSQTLIGDSSTNFINVSTATNGSIDFGRTASSINMASDSTYTTVNIATASNMQGYVQIANGSGTQGPSGRGVYIGNLGVGEVRIEGYNSAINGSAAGRVDVGTSITTGSVSIGTGMTTGYVSIGGSLSTLHLGGGYVSIGGSSSTLYLGGKIVSDHLDASFNTRAPLASPALTGIPTSTTAGVGTNTTQIATTAFVAGEINALINSAPGALNTLNELATALGNDVAFSTTVTNLLASKAPSASPSFTGTVVSAGDVSLNSKLSVLSDVSLNSKLFVKGDVSFNNFVTVGGNVHSKGLYASENSYVKQINVGLNYDYFYGFDNNLVNSGLAGPLYNFSNNGISETYSSTDFQTGTSSITFNGTNQYLTFPNFTFKNTGFSIAFWGKFDVSSNMSRPIFNIQDVTNSQTVLTSYVFAGNNLYVNYNLNGVLQSSIFSSVANGDNTWRHYLYTMSYSATNTGTMKAYVNGSLVSTVSNTYFPNIASTYNFYLAKNSVNHYLIGNFDQIIIQNNVINDADALKIYNKSAGIYNSVVGTASTNIKTGELIVNGGVGIGGNVNVGGILNIISDVSMNSNLSVGSKITVGSRDDDYNYYYEFENNLLNSGKTGTAYDGSNNGIAVAYDSDVSIVKSGFYDLSLNGTTQYVTIPNFTYKTTGFSIAFWVKLNSSQLLKDIITIYMSANQYLQISTNSMGIPVCNIRYSSTQITTLTDDLHLNSIDNDQWTHLAVTCSYAANGSATSSVNFYINGDSYFTQTTSGYYPGTGVPATITIGKTVASANYTRMQIDMLIMNDSVFSSTKIIDLKTLSSYKYDSTSNFIANDDISIKGNASVKGNIYSNNINAYDKDSQFYIGYELSHGQELWFGSVLCPSIRLMAPFYNMCSIDKINSSNRNHGYQRTATATTTAFTTSASNIVNTPIPDLGVYQVEGWAKLTYSGTPSSGTWIRVGLSTTSATFNDTMTNDSYVLSSGNFYARINSVIQYSTNGYIYLIGQYGGTAPTSTVTANIKITKLA